ncbi:carboxyltransferase domain-containing protein, partial [Actinomycetospora straminea]|uniref:carboxyltransferase domain-containing protein n=1 Tax=Actinomycetospora straminea TaxID=663607 RepID=UPI0031ECC4B3
MKLRLETAAMDVLTVRLFDTIDESNMAWIIAADQALRDALGEALIDLIPSYTTLLVHYDCLRLTFVQATTLIRSEIEATGNESDHQLSLSGPEITLSGKAAENIGLAMHELATNALKYGALANPTGHINVAWNIDGTADKPALVLT